MTIAAPNVKNNHLVRQFLYLFRRTKVRPVLIHVNGVQKDVMESGYFSNIIDFGQFLRKK